MSNQVVMSGPNGSRVNEQVALVTLYVRYSEGKPNAARSAADRTLTIRRLSLPRPRDGARVGDPARVSSLFHGNDQYRVFRVTEHNKWSVCIGLDIVQRQA